MNFNYSNIYIWVRQSWIFRKLYLLIKLYLTKSRFSHHAQFAEDVAIVGFFPKYFKGFFVDVGCYHPKKYNNTWKLYKKGWRGINIDIDSIKIEAFDIVRPNDININCAISNHEGKVAYYTNGFYSLITSLDASFVTDKKDVNSRDILKKTTNCARLTDIIDKTKYKDQKIDFLSVDAEGHDLAVLQSLNFDKYDPSLVAVETHEAIFSGVEKSDVYRFLLAKGYCLVGWYCLTLLMANKKLQRTLADLRR